MAPPIDSDSEDEDSDDEEVLDDEDVLDDDEHLDLDDDHNFLRRSRQSLGLVESYLPGWMQEDAFREFYQNWEDSIVETSQLLHWDFKPIDKGFDKNGIYIFEGRHPITDKLLGFIRFKDGIIEFTNFGAQLHRRALNMGETSKRGNRQAAGTHGEGFKVASLVMVRHGHRVQYEASRSRWTMKFWGKDEDILYCFLSKPEDETIEKQILAYEKKVAKGKPRELKNNIWEDVTVRIGRVRGQGLKIDPQDFLKWIKVCIDINPPSKIIRTVHGSLILDPKFHNKIYLKGLLLKGRSSEKKFKFGYNFLEGDVNRDRERLKNPVHEAKVLAAIWDEAIKLQEEETLDPYLSMLREAKFADVHAVEDRISKDVAEKLWQRLLAQDVNGECFYHDDRNGDNDVEIISNSLKKKPEQLSNLIWTPLRTYGLVRTPREQQSYLLHQAPLTQSRTTPYSSGMERALRAALALDARTRDLELAFKSGVKTDLDLRVYGLSLEINDKWLSFTDGHRLAPCWLSRQVNREHSDSDHFSCDHIVTDLYELVLHELKRTPRVSFDKPLESDSFLYQRVCENLRQMPIMVKSKAGNSSKTIEVSWTDLEGDMLSRLYRLDPKCRVTLHRERTCSGRREDLLLSVPGSAEIKQLTRSNISRNQDSSSCGCPERVVSQKNFSATFIELETEEEYFPMVSRDDSQAFFGLAPKGIKPKSALANKSGPCDTSKRTPARTSAPKEDYSLFDSGDLYGVSSDDDEPLSDAVFNHPPLQQSSNRKVANRNIVSSRLSQHPNTPHFASPVPGIASASSPAPGIENLHPNISIEEAIVEKQQQISAQEKLLQELRASFEASQQKCSELENHLVQSNTVNTDLEEQLAMKTQELDHAKSDDENYQGQLEVAAQECLAKISQIDEAATTIERLQRDIQDANERLQAQQKKIDDLNAKIKAFNDGQVAGSELAGVSSTQVQQLETTNNQLRTQRRGLKDRIADLERRLRAAEDAYDTQVRLAADTAQRRDRTSTSLRPKSELGDDTESNNRLKQERYNSNDDEDDEVGTSTRSSRPPKRRRISININEAGTIDLTED
ncbi:hypothetical protein IFR05_002977 [Cadophora sp. M221]|nr:hypothetical protein IFR05_002977 [Cadophora sp. M221]